MTAFCIKNAGVPEDFFEIISDILRKQAEERGCVLSDNGITLSVKQDKKMCCRSTALFAGHGSGKQGCLSVRQ